MTRKKSKKDQRPRISPVVKARNRILRRPWRSQPGTPRVVSDYLAKAGLTCKLSADLYKTDLLSRFGDAAVEYLNSCGIDREVTAESHALTSPNLDMALAIRSKLWGDRYEEFLSWFTTANLPPVERVLDIGCDIGIHTCFFAMQFPYAEVTGFDQCMKCIQCAQRLAERLNLKNVQFLQATLPSLPEGLVNRKFDMVVSSCVAGYFDDAPLTPVRSIEEAQAQPLGPKQVEYARIQAGFLANENSLLIACDRFVFPRTLAWWIRGLREAGIYVHHDRIELLEFINAWDEPISIPVLVGSMRRTDLVTPDEIRKLWLVDFSGHGGELAYLMAAAEYFFLETSPKELLVGFRCIPPGAPTYCKELWKAGSSLLTYKYDASGGFLLEYDIENLPEILEDCRHAARADSDGGTVEEYGPEAYSQPPAGASDDSAADRPAGETPASEAVAGSGGQDVPGT